jgi:hypothetical protein
MKKILSAFGIVSIAAMFLFGTPAAMAAVPTAALTSPQAGITSITGNGTVSGSESGTHSILLTDATASTLTGTDVESNTVADAFANTLAGTETISLTIGGEAITTAALAAAVADTATLADVATDMQTKINAETTSVDVTVTVGGASPGKFFVITSAVAGSTSSISGTMTGSGFEPLGFAAVSGVAGLDAKAVDTFTAATGSNGLFVAANPGGTKTIAHTPVAGTPSTYAGLKPLLVAASAMINGITINATGVLSNGTATIIQTAGAADGTGNIDITGTATVIAGVANEITLEGIDDAGNRDLTYTGSKNITFGGPAVLGTCTPSVEGTDIGSATAITFTSGITSGTNATLLACASADVTLTAADGAVNSTGHTLAITVNPATIGTLTCSSGGSSGVINLAWTNPAGVNNGYEAKYYAAAIDGSNYASATTYTQAWVSGTVGAANSQVLTGFNPGTNYWFALKALGLNSNESAVSNTVLCTAPPFGGSSGSTADTQAPTTQIISPAGNSTVATGTVVVKGTTKDNGTSSIQKVEVSLDGGTTWVPAVTTTADGVNVLWEYTIANAAAGTMSIRARATDWVNNVETNGPSITLAVSATAPTTPVTTTPTITVPAGLTGVQAQIYTLQVQLVSLLQQLLAMLLAAR